MSKETLASTSHCMLPRQAFEFTSDAMITCSAQFLVQNSMRAAEWSFSSFCWEEETFGSGRKASKVARTTSLVSLQGTGAPMFKHSNWSQLPLSDIYRDRLHDVDQQWAC
jgi:hypothetical protein